MAGISQIEMANQLKVDRSTINKHEKSEDPLSKEKLDLAAKILGCVVDKDHPGSWLRYGCEEVHWWRHGKGFWEKPYRRVGLYRRNPIWAEPWLMSFVRIIGARFGKIVRGAGKFYVVPRIRDDGIIEMQPFQIIEVRPIVMLRRLL
jgi:transcriptional regulator with XRE-family HTH domain